MTLLCLARCQSVASTDLIGICRQSTRCGFSCWKSTTSRYASDICVACCVNLSRLQLCSMHLYTVRFRSSIQVVASLSSISLQYLWRVLPLWCSCGTYLVDNPKRLEIRSTAASGLNVPDATQVTLLCSGATNHRRLRILVHHAVTIRRNLDDAGRGHASNSPKLGWPIADGGVQHGAGAGGDDARRGSLDYSKT